MVGAIIAITGITFLIAGFLGEFINGPHGEYWRYRIRQAWEARKTKGQAKKHRNEPIYERIAKAYEWKAELHLRQGNIEQARDEFRKAEKTRREAMEAMMNGQEPKL